MPQSRNYITIVSGLPRSGTSMMMQILQAGGMPILADGLRESDPDNPRGYLEFEPVKKLATTRDWMPNALGKAVKIVHALLPSLPPGFPYRIILMRRDIREVVASQRVMLERNAKTGANLPDLRLAQLLTADLQNAVALVKQNPDCRLLEIEHRHCLTETSRIAATVNSFLDNRLDEAKMTSAVDATLYRQRL